MKEKGGKGKKVRTVFCARLLTVLDNKIYLKLKTILEGIFFLQFLLKGTNTIFLFFQLDLFGIYFLFNYT